MTAAQTILIVLITVRGLGCFAVIGRIGRPVKPLTNSGAIGGVIGNLMLIAAFAYVLASIR